LQDGHLSAETIAQSGISLLLAGTDTSGGGVTAVMEMVALFPEVMQKLRQEQQQVSVHSSAVLVSPQRCSALLARSGGKLMFLMSSVTSIVTSPSCVGEVAVLDMASVCSATWFCWLCSSVRADCFLMAFKGFGHEPGHNGASELSLRTCLYLRVQGSMRVQFVTCVVVTVWLGG
jgi:hypothetical protein